MKGLTIVSALAWIDVGFLLGELLESKPDIKTEIIRVADLEHTLVRNDRQLVKEKTITV